MGRRNFVFLEEFFPRNLHNISLVKKLFLIFIMLQKIVGTTMWEIFLLDDILADLFKTLLDSQIERKQFVDNFRINLNRLFFGSEFLTQVVWDVVFEPDVVSDFLYG